MSDTFNHAGEAFDRLLNGEGEEEIEGWECDRCGYINDYGASQCRGCGTRENECRVIDDILDF